MLSPARYFENLFAEEAITAPRLVNFAADHINRLINQNTTRIWETLLALLTPATEAAATEVGDVDTARTLRLGRTLTVDRQIELFKDYMSENEPFIARALGGKDTAAYQEFYPAGQDEYRRANKTTLPVFLDRLAEAATRHAALLGEDITAALQGFKTTYETARDLQQQQKGAFDDNRAERSDAILALQLLLTRSIHQVADRYPGDVEQCSSLYDFGRLYPQGGGGEEEEEATPTP